MEYSLQSYNVHKPIVAELLKLARLRGTSKPHLLLYGPPGTGKTTLANLYVSRHQTAKFNQLKLNASDTRGIDTIRYSVQQFVRHTALDGGQKFVVLDQCDYLTNDAQAALRCIMQQYKQAANFILICNNLYKVSQAIRSRCKCMKVGLLTDTQMRVIVNNLKTERGIQLSPQRVRELVANSRGDIRYIENHLVSADQTLKGVKDLLGMADSELVAYLRTIDKPVKGLLEDFLGYILELPASEAGVQAIYLLAQCDLAIARGGSEVIQFMATINKLRRVLR